ncbi:MAG: molybdopterin-dependent oxidoreductase [Pseudomonadota bacterium]
MSAMFTISHLMVGAFTSALLLSASHVLAELAAPVGPVILTVDGAITATNAPNAAQFDLAALQAMPVVTFDTSTTWTEGVKTFTGVPLKSLLEAVGATGGEVQATALNNYSVRIPIDSLTDTAPIVAYHIDGETFSRRDKGPLWIVYPYDSSANFQNELVYGRSIWQLERLTSGE